MSLLQTTAHVAYRPHRPVAADVATRRIGSLDVLTVTGEDAVAMLRKALAGPGLTRLAFANAHCVNIAAGDEAYRRCLRDFLLLPDGVGMDVGSRVLYGRPFPENLNGTDFIPRFLVDVDTPLRVALVGGEPGIAERAAKNLASMLPEHVYLPVSHGFFAAGPETTAVLAALRRARADVVLIGLGVPAQELFIARHLNDSHARIAVGVGALLDFAAGKVPRAPRLVRQFRLEWVYRLSLEPRRLARRYILGNPFFLLRIAGQRLAARRLPGAR